jgi:hypothetical protein
METICLLLLQHSTDRITACVSVECEGLIEIRDDEHGLMCDGLFKRIHRALLIGTPHEWGVVSQQVGQRSSKRAEVAYEATIIPSEP